MSAWFDAVSSLKVKLSAKALPDLVFKCIRLVDAQRLEDGRAVVVDRISGQVMFEAPPKHEVPGRMEGMFDWLERKLAADAA